MKAHRIRFICPSCRGTQSIEFDASTTDINCPDCNGQVRVTPDAVQDETMDRCLVCPSTELFVRKNFPQRLGVTIVVLGFALSSWAWFHHMVVATFAILMITALIDVVLFALVGEVLECYRCHAQYQGVSGLESHEGFDLEIHEKHRQQLARLSMSAQETQP